MTVESFKTKRPMDRPNTTDIDRSMTLSEHILSENPHPNYSNSISDAVDQAIMHLGSRTLDNAGNVTNSPHLDQNGRQLFAGRTHNHDSLYSKLNHSHSDLEASINELSEILSNISGSVDGRIFAEIGFFQPEYTDTTQTSDESRLTSRVRDLDKQIDGGYYYFIAGDQYKKYGSSGSSYTLEEADIIHAPEDVATPFLLINVPGELELTEPESTKLFRTIQRVIDSNGCSWIRTGTATGNQITTESRITNLYFTIPEVKSETQLSSYSEEAQNFANNIREFGLSGVYEYDTGMGYFIHTSNHNNRIELEFDASMSDPDNEDSSPIGYIVKVYNEQEVIISAKTSIIESDDSVFGSNNDLYEMIKNITNLPWFDVEDTTHPEVFDTQDITTYKYITSESITVYTPTAYTFDSWTGCGGGTSEGNPGDHNHDGIYAPVSHTHSIADVSNLNTELNSKLSAPTGGTTGQFLQKTVDGTKWTTVTQNTGNMTTSVYDSNNDGVVNAADYASSAGAVAWSNVVGAPTSFAASSHTHSISDVAGLQIALNSKSSIGHTHAITNITGLESALDSKMPIPANTGSTGDALIKTPTGVVWSSIANGDGIGTWIDYSKPILAEARVTLHNSNYVSSRQILFEYEVENTGFVEIQYTHPDGADLAMMYFDNVSSRTSNSSGELQICYGSPVVLFKTTHATFDNEYEIPTEVIYTRSSILLYETQGTTLLFGSPIVSSGNIVGITGSRINDTYTLGTDSRFGVIREFGPGYQLPTASTIVPTNSASGDMKKIEYATSGVLGVVDSAVNARYASSAGSVRWADITEVPTSFAASSHSHSISDIISLQDTLNGKAASNHNHTGVYANSSHSHAISDVTNLQETIDSKANSSHTHSTVDITNFDSAVTEVVSNAGFTKNTGNYSKPSTGIPSSDLSSYVQSAITKANAAAPNSSFNSLSTSVSSLSDTVNSLSTTVTSVVTNINTLSSTLSSISSSIATIDNDPVGTIKWVVAHTTDMSYTKLVTTGKWTLLNGKQLIGAHYSDMVSRGMDKPNNYYRGVTISAVMIHVPSDATTKTGAQLINSGDTGLYYRLGSYTSDEYNYGVDETKTYTSCVASFVERYESFDTRMCSTSVDSNWSSTASTTASNAAKDPSISPFYYMLMNNNTTSIVLVNNIHINEFSLDYHYEDCGSFTYSSGYQYAKTIYHLQNFRIYVNSEVSSTNNFDYVQDQLTSLASLTPTSSSIKLFNDSIFNSGRAKIYKIYSNGDISTTEYYSISSVASTNLFASCLSANVSINNDVRSAVSFNKYTAARHVDVMLIDLTNESTVIGSNDGDWIGTYTDGKLPSPVVQGIVSYGNTVLASGNTMSTTRTSSYTVTNGVYGKSSKVVPSGIHALPMIKIAK